MTKATNTRSKSSKTVTKKPAKTESSASGKADAKKKAASSAKPDSKKPVAKTLAAKKPVAKAPAAKAGSAGSKVKKKDSAAPSRAEQIRAIALSFPETSEDFPWGHSAFKVKNKTFCWMSFAETGMRLTVKLTDSRFSALAMPGVEESNYGLGKHGWVTALFSDRNEFPIAMLSKWLRESFYAVAPKTLVKSMDGAGVKKVVKKRAR